MPISLHNVYSGYSRGSYILKDINMEISSNTIVLGPNGSGKTTLFRTIIGITPTVKGEVKIDDLDLETIRGFPGLVSTNLREVYIQYVASAWELASLYLDLQGGDFGRFNDLVRFFNIARDLDKKPYKLSTGTQTLLYNLIALSTNARYVLLDEPFESVDPAKRVLLLKEIINYRGTVLLNTHTTWLLKQMSEWNVYLMVRGHVYGVISVNELVSSRISLSRGLDTLLELKLEDKSIYLNKVNGIPLSELDSLDKLYEVITWQ
ncbi:MAG: ATP-binding cassette domain-containing protein [Ignisphaera sp.]